MRQGTVRRGTVPMPFVRRNPDHIARQDMLNRITFRLNQPSPGNHDERLSQWMGMPRGACSGFKVYHRSAITVRYFRRKPGFDRDVAGEMIRRARRRCTVFNDLEGLRRIQRSAGSQNR